ncbi:glycogen debranching enzyme [Zophobas morio]|uniref:glycogen debranching enzyme n=1 Tax=Zophobas morio TaxID=2755281 RepID=UPI0030828682
MNKHASKDATVVILFKTTFSFLWKFYIFVFAFQLSLLKHATSVAFRLTKTLCLWCILKLLGVSRYLEQISGSRGSSTDEQEGTPESDKSKPKKSRQKPKKSPTKEPSFSTTLTTPIEEVIEETINEEVKNSDSAEPKASKPKKRNKSARAKKISEAAKPKTATDDSDSLSSPSEDFAFLPVKERRKKSPKTKIDDLPKSSLIEHYQPRRRKLVETVKDEFVVIEKPVKNPENLVQIVNKESGKSVYLENKESKKVHAKISYASVASQRFNESLEELLKEEQLSQKKVSFNENDSSREVEETRKFITEERESETTVGNEGASKSSNEDFEDAEAVVEQTESQPQQSDSGEIKKEDFGEETIAKQQNPVVESSYSEEVKNEELVHEIQSEERRLVDLLEEEEKESEENVLPYFQNNLPDEQVFGDIQTLTHTLILNERAASLEDTNQSSLEEDKFIQIEENHFIVNGEKSETVEEREHDNEELDKVNGDELLEVEEIQQRKFVKTAQCAPNGNNSSSRIVETDDPSSVEELEAAVYETPFQEEFVYVTEAEVKTNGEDLEFEDTQLVETKPFKMSSGTQIRVFTLNDKEHQDSTLYRLEKNWILQFRLGPSLLGRKVSLYCNYPKENEEFKRNSYNLLKWSQDEGCKYSDDTALLTEITVKISGSFHYYFTYEGGERDKHQGSGFFLVDPILKYGNNEQLPLDGIQCQTFLTKGLGPFDTWEGKLKVAKESGYNMIHFTPIQELGASNSSYSLSEQLKVNPLFTKQTGKETTFQDVETLIKKIRTEWKMVSICDIVLNHTANESEWLKDHPEVTYNCENCPYMRPAYLLDAALHQFSLDVVKGLYEDKGIPVEVNSEDHLKAIRYHLHAFITTLKIHELSTCDVSKTVDEFLTLIRNKIPPNQENPNEGEKMVLVQDPQYRRLESTVDLNLAVKLYNVYRNDCFDEETRIKKCSEEFKNKLDSLNKRVIDEFDDHLKAAIDNAIAGIRYFRVQHDGPKIKEVSVKSPLVDRYFTDYGSPGSVEEHEEVMYSKNGRFLMAHNGWVMNSDPLRNFAAPGSNVYVRRELIAWGDSVKLRFGEKPEDCPFLWQHMKTYVELTARIFDGVRLDNCHSTPIPVAEYLLDCARKVKPDLYVVAELFTNSDLTDNIFVNRLGITSLIREAMSAWDSHEQGRLVYRYGGSPVGSFYQPRIRPLVPSIAHALFLDLTHDNPSPVEKRSVFDLLPSTALVNMACCASGSNRGYDELVPHHIHVVDETRQYTEWSDDENLSTGNARYVTKKSGIIAAKKALNDLHFLLGDEGFNQVYVDQMDPDVVAVTRHCPETHQSYVLVAFTAFSHPPEEAANHQRGIRALRVEGVLDEIVLEATLNHVTSKSGSKYTKTQNFCKDGKWINGLSEYRVTVKEHIQPQDSDFFEKVNSGNPNVIQLNFKNFKPGSVAIIKVSLPEDMTQAIKNVRTLISHFTLNKENELWKIVTKMGLADLNRALYRCDQEERDEGHGFDTYEIPNFGRLVYAGFQGFMSLLSTIRPSNDLGHPMCANLRDGNWMIDYIWQRLKLDEGTKSLGQWFEENTKSLKAIPRYLVPCYFDVIVTGVYILLYEQSYNLMSDFVKHGSTFVKGLAMGSIQFGAYIKSADLPVLSPTLAEPKPPHRKSDKGEKIQACVTLSAGLPHFSVGYMRNWGRDTFIALRGLFLLTGRYQEARYHILGYAGCLRHGLIPNLLDGGRNSRFNCRDAIWWWLHCVKTYTEDAPNGLSILTDKVSRIFPSDDSPAQPAGTHDQPLHAVIQEALNTHFQGLVFRERNAGRQIDEHMTDAGFNNQIGIHPDTGFVFGGNSFNCGTWMDKMGSSDKAGIRGKPATPRDGSAIELIGLSKSVITWLAGLSAKGAYPHSGVERTGKNGVVTKWTFEEWATKIQNNFEKYFWVNTTPTDGEIRPDLVNKRGIYKDCYGASQEWTDFQLRCNFPIAMVVAPELFQPGHAWAALKQAEKYLLGPLGMKTLDPEDWAYNGNYDNSNDSDNRNVAHGFNYHQGPEWVWPVGFYLRARLQFAAANGELAKTVANTKVVLAKHFVELQTSTWRGLPELTNKDGAYCKDSSRTQAWSMSCILEVLHDLQRIEKTQPSIN